MRYQDMMLYRASALLTAAVASLIVSACSSNSVASQASPAPSAIATARVKTAAEKLADAKHAAAARRAEIVRAAAQRRADIARAAAERREDVANAREAKRQARVPMYAYWHAASAALDAATASVRQGAEAINNGDLVDASTAYSNCASEADDAFSASDKDVPDGWTDVSNALGVAASKLQDACKEAVTAVDEQKPSEIAEVQSEIGEFQNYQLAALAKAYELWTAAGGNVRDL